MANTIGSLVISILGDISGLDKSLTAAQKHTNDLAKDLGELGKKLTRSVTLPILAAGAAMVKAAADFEYGMSKVKALTGATAEEMEMLNNQARLLGTTTRYSATQASEAMAFLAMSGFEVNEIFNMMPGTLDLAASASIDLGTAADIVTNIMMGFGFESEKLGYAVDVLTKQFTNSNTDLTQLGTAFKYVGPVARAFGVSIEETAAAIGALSDAGIQGSLAGTGLRTIITKLASQSERLGITVLDTAGNMIPLADQIEQLEKRGITATEVMKVFGQRGGPSMNYLLNIGSKGVREMTDRLKDVEGTAKTIAEIRLDTFTGEFLKLKNTAYDLGIEFGNLVLPALTDLAIKLKDVVKWFTALNDEQQSNIIKTALWAAAIGPALRLMSSLPDLISSISVAFDLLKTKLIPFLLTGVGSVIAGAVAGFVALALAIKDAKAAKKQFDDDEKANHMFDYSAPLEENLATLRVFRLEVAGLQKDYDTAYKALKDAPNPRLAGSGLPAQEAELNRLKALLTVFEDRAAQMERIAAAKVIDDKNAERILNEMARAEAIAAEEAVERAEADAIAKQAALEYAAAMQDTLDAYIAMENEIIVVNQLMADGLITEEEGLDVIIDLRAKWRGDLLRSIQLGKLNVNEVAKGFKTQFALNEKSLNASRERVAALSKDRDKEANNAAKTADENQAINENNLKRLQEYGKSEIDLIKARYAEELRLAREKNADEYTIHQYYAKLIKDMEDKAAADSIATKRREAVEKLEVVADLAKETINLLSQLTSNMYATETAAVEKKFDALTTEEKAYQAFLNAQDSKRYNAMSAEEKREYNLQKAADASRVEQDKKKALALHAIEVKQFKANQAFALAEIAINTAMAIAKIWSQTGVLAPFLTVGAVIMGGIQAGIVKAKQPPAAPSFAQGGIVMPQRGGMLANVADGGQPEVIFPLDQLERFLSRQNNVDFGGSEGGGGTINLVVKIDSKPILDKIFPATKNRTILISQGAVV